MRDEATHGVASVAEEKRWNRANMNTDLVSHEGKRLVVGNCDAMNGCNTRKWIIKCLCKEQDYISTLLLMMTHFGFGTE